MEYQAYPMPDSYPDYPNHWEIQRYFEDFVEHFKLTDQEITFRTRVDRAVPTADGPGYDVTITSLADPDAAPETRRYRCPGRERASLEPRAGPSRRFPGSSPARSCTATTTRLRTSCSASGW